MTSDRNFKATAHNRSDVLGTTYRRARLQIQEQLEWLSAHPKVPVMWDIARSGASPLPSVAAHRAALGAVELALRDFHVLTGATSRDTWRTIDGHIDMDWHGGPYAHEVVQKLVRIGDDPESGTIEPGELAAGVSRVGDLNAVWIYGVRVRFRPYSPIGAEASRKQAWAALRTSTT
ncbi:hypothetical protein [Lentzea flava]|uniref:Uncharacterized protein n=1 Tax=Lentzea flava TaxID=103732 RepID=A0ABQ2UJF9_9PSEU|nr:hypothetical protein [Lentzea flava]MCP2199929.1 hypothetical protein [Lentzea flava]GGU39880.1 hypothetical protein GCM10010178_35320 [Lentzea flava]